MCSGLNWEGHIRLQLGAPCVFKSELTLGYSRQIGNFESDARFSAGDACICDLTRALGLDLQICTKKAVESNHRVLPRNESRRLETSDLRRKHRVRRRRKFFWRILCYFREAAGGHQQPCKRRTQNQANHEPGESFSYSVQKRASGFHSMILRSYPSGEVPCEVQQQRCRSPLNYGEDRYGSAAFRRTDRESPVQVERRFEDETRLQHQVTAFASRLEECHHYETRSMRHALYAVIGRSL